jgi:hypothetical protein
MLRVSINISQKNINKRECRSYELEVKYTKKIKKNNGKIFLDYWGSSNFNVMPLYLKQSIFNNVKKKKNRVKNQ